MHRSSSSNSSSLSWLNVQRLHHYLLIPNVLSVKNVIPWLRLLKPNYYQRPLRVFVVLGCQVPSVGFPKILLAVQIVSDPVLLVQ